MFKSILAVLALCTVTACGMLPQPFRDAPRATTDNPLLDVPSAVGIAILPVAGAPAPLDHQIPQALATRLEALDIPAEPVENNAGLGFTLQSEIQDMTSTPSGVTATIVWTLRTRRGAATGSYRQPITAPSAAWTGGDAQAPGISTQLAGAAAEAIANLVGGNGPVQTEVQKERFPHVAVQPLEGASGDGAQSLRIALIQILFERGVVRDDINPEVVLSATMTSKAAPNDQQNVEIVWRAVTRDGKDLGTVKLANTIPNGALDGPWGPTAFAIANAAVGDLLALLTSKPKS